MRQPCLPCMPDSVADACVPCAQPSSAGSPAAARFDLSGLYLAVGGTEARVVGTKQDWAPLTDLSAAIGNKVISRLSNFNLTPWRHECTYREHAAPEGPQGLLQRHESMTRTFRKIELYKFHRAQAGDLSYVRLL